MHASGPVPAQLWGIDNASKVCLHVVAEKPADKSLAAILERGFRQILLLQHGISAFISTLSWTFRCHNVTTVVVPLAVWQNQGKSGTVIVS